MTSDVSHGAPAREDVSGPSHAAAGPEPPRASVSGGGTRRTRTFSASALAERVAGGASLVAAGAYIAVFLALAMLRAPYPYQLEWMEGGILQHVLRVVDGQPLYVAPALEFTPFVYAPLYYWAGAIAVGLAGEAYLPLRALSIVSALACLVLLYELARREVRCPRLALLAPGLFAACYPLSGAWLDLARVDSLALALLLGSALIVRAASSAPLLAMAGLLAALSLLTKQSGLPVAAALGCYAVAYCGNRQRLVYPLAVIGSTGAAILTLNRATNGWFLYYAYALPSTHRIVTERVLGFWADDLRLLLPSILIALFALVKILRWRRARDGAFWALLLAGSIAASWASRVHVGGWLNALLPACAALSLGLPIGVATLGTAGRPSRGAGRTGRDKLALPDQRSVGVSWTSLAVSLAVLAQLLVLAYDPRTHLPAPGDARAGDALVARLQRVDGDVFVPFHPRLAARAGRSSFAHAMALEDVFRSRDESRRLALRRELSAALRSGRFEAIVLDRDRWGMLREIEERYARAGPAFAGDQEFWPVTGLRTRPQAVYVRRDLARGGTIPASAPEDRAQAPHSR